MTVTANSQYPPTILRIVDVWNRVRSRTDLPKGRRELTGANCYGSLDNRWVQEEKSLSVYGNMKDPHRDLLAFCNTCPVRQICLEDALRFGDIGIRGGTTHSQRIVSQRLSRRPIRAGF